MFHTLGVPGWIPFVGVRNSVLQSIKPFRRKICRKAREWEQTESPSASVIIFLRGPMEPPSGCTTQQQPMDLNFMSLNPPPLWAPWQGRPVIFLAGTGILLLTDQIDGGFEGKYVAVWPVNTNHRPPARTQCPYSKKLSYIGRFCDGEG